MFGLKPKLGKESPLNLVSRCADGTPMRPLVARTKGTQCAWAGGRLVGGGEAACRVCCDGHRRVRSPYRFLTCLSREQRRGFRAGLLVAVARHQGAGSPETFFFLLLTSAHVYAPVQFPDPCRCPEAHGEDIGFAHRLFNGKGAGTARERERRVRCCDLVVSRKCREPT